MVKKMKFLIWGILLLMVIAIAGCNPSQATENLEVDLPVVTHRSTDLPASTVTATAEIEQFNLESDQAEGLEDIDPQAGIPSEQTTHCEKCHANKAMLIETADPVEDVESDNEGAG